MTCSFYSVQLLATLDEYGRGLLAKATRRAKYWQVLVDDFWPPVSIGEIALIVEASVRIGDFDLARSTVCEKANTLGLPGPQQTELLDWIAAQEFLR